MTMFSFTERKGDKKKFKGIKIYFKKTSKGGLGERGQGLRIGKYKLVVREQPRGSNENTGTTVNSNVRTGCGASRGAGNIEEICM